MRAQFRAVWSPVVQAQLSGEDVMRTQFGLVASAALVAMLAWSPPVVAQQKTIRQCGEEGAANKAGLAESGKTDRFFVAECPGVPMPPISPVELGKGQY